MLLRFSFLLTSLIFSAILMLFSNRFGGRRMTKEKYIKPCKITDELYCIGVSGNPSHIITTSEGIVMIDTGCPDAFETLKICRSLNG